MGRHGADGESNDDSMISDSMIVRGNEKLTMSQLAAIKANKPKGKGQGKDGYGDKNSDFQSSNFDSDSKASDYEDDAELQSDVSGETHTFEESSISSTTSFSSSDDEETG